MNSFELNKIFGAILATLVFVMGVGFIAEEIYAPIENRGSGFELPEPEETAEGEAPEAEQETQIAALLQTASAEAGASVAARCQGCHDLSEANTNRVGPGLYGIVGHVIASHEGFSYSAALSALGEAGEEWDYAHLDAFLTSPQGFAPGTTMAFPGIANAEDRADLIAYLRELSDDPLPLPEAPAEGEAAPAEEAPAEAVEAEAAEDAAPAEEVAPVEEEAPAAEEPADEPAAAEDEAAAAEDAPVAAAAASGYVTEAQVAAGQSAYQQNCASCHGQDIIHSIAGYPNVGLFYSFVSSAMPADNPGGLPQQTYADIIAYLLSENGHPIGTETLPANPAVLSEIDPRALGQEAAPAEEAAPVEEEAPAAEEAPAEAVEAEAAEDAAPAEEVAPVEEEAPAAEEPADEPAAAEDEAAAAEDAPVAAAAASGYVTEAQVAAGQSAYQQNCASCHGQDIVHSIAGYPNVGLFYSFVSSAMPADNPGGLPQQTYADIIAYLLSENGHPIGTETLPANPAVLNEIDPRALGQ